MSDTIPADVRLFLAAVRRELADVDPDELAEITDGLEADLSDLVAERGPSALGDARSYAAELRAAAGIATPRARRSRPSVTGVLDACHAWFDAQVDRMPGDGRAMLDCLRPAWWILRAWTAVTLIDLTFGTASYTGISPLPTLNGLGLPLLIVAIGVSIQIGRGTWWPGGSRGGASRLILLALNGVAVVAAGVALVEMPSYRVEPGSWDEGYSQGLVDAEQANIGDGLWLNGRPVANMYPYDAQGRPLAGVQLFDQNGTAIAVTGRPLCPNGNGEGGYTPIPADAEDSVCNHWETGEPVNGFVVYPWTNGQAQVLNVFPLALREQARLDPSATAFQEKDRPTMGTWPFAEAPAVSLPGTTGGVQEVPEK